MSTLNKFMVGVAVGAAFGILYAPAKGSKTRRRLARAGSKIKESFQDLKDSVSNRIDDMRDNIEDITEETEFTSTIPIA